MARMEEQLAAEQRLRCETEQRLTQHLNSLVGVSISEQLDVLRQQLVEERMQRQAGMASRFHHEVMDETRNPLKSIHFFDFESILYSLSLGFRQTFSLRIDRWVF